MAWLRSGATLARNLTNHTCASLQLAFIYLAQLTPLRCLPSTEKLFAPPSRWSTQGRYRNDAAFRKALRRVCLTLGRREGILSRRPSRGAQGDAKDPILRTAHHSRTDRGMPIYSRFSLAPGTPAIESQARNDVCDGMSVVRKRLLSDITSPSSLQNVRTLSGVNRRNRETR
jgi:hypothetical protein